MRYSQKAADVSATYLEKKINKCAAGHLGPEIYWQSRSRTYKPKEEYMCLNCLLPLDRYAMETPYHLKNFEFSI